MVGVVGASTLLLMLIVMPAAAGAQTRTEGIEGGVTAGESGAAIANFEGRTIDLAGDWGEATACLVWRQGGVLECFRTSDELEAREAELAPRPPALEAPAPGSAYAAYSCSSSLRLYDDNWYGGRRLSFWDRGYWQNLRDYGFEDQTSSYIVGGCPVYLAEHGDGGGWWYPGPTYPYAGEPAMFWDWQDTISSIYIG